MQMTDFNQIQLTPLSDAEMIETNGGGWFNWFIKGNLLFEAYKGIAGNWDEIKTRFYEGWNIDKKKN